MGPKARQSKREIFAQHSRIRGPGVCLRVSYEVLAQRGADIRMARGYVIWPNRSARACIGGPNQFVRSHWECDQFAQLEMEVGPKNVILPQIYRR